MNNIEVFCDKHGIDPQTLIDVYEQKLKDIVNMAQSDGVMLIMEERRRQIEVEEFDVINDFGYDVMQLSAAAGCYIANAHNKWFPENTHTEIEETSRFQVLVDDGEKFDTWVDGWPWDKQWDKRKKHGIIRSLVIAGALIAAEIDRLQNPSI